MEEPKTSDEAEEAYRNIMNSMPEGTLVYFNNEATGVKSTPELRVEHIGEDVISLTETPHQGFPTWEISVDPRDNRLSLYQITQDGVEWYESIVTITIAGWSAPVS